MSKALNFYEEEILKGEKKVNELNSIISKLSILRLIIMLLIVGAGYYFYKQENLLFMGTTIIIGFLIFIVVAFFHNKKINEKNYEEIFLDINKRGINRINGNFKEEDEGKEFIDDDHNFTSDLDIFGRNSLFQMINSTKTKFGRNRLFEILSLKDKISREEINKRQEAIKELGKKVKWRQNLEAKATLRKSGIKDVSDLIEWSKNSSPVKLWFKIVPYMFITLTLISIILVILRVLPVSYLILVFILNYVVVNVITKDLKSVINLFSNHKKDIEAFANLLKLIEDENFESKLLCDLKEELKVDGTPSYKEMHGLKSLVDWIGDSTSNAYYLLLNVTILSDAFILRNLEEWRIKNGRKLESWLNIMGEFEALSSIANLDFDFESWSYPTIENEDIVMGTNIAHPMLGEKAVSNSFSLAKVNEEYRKVALITGSNMSGKSTFLRTVGLNLILSYIGAPTCSKKFNCGIFNIYTCMRTKDNLEESISSFYAEILRIKLLIEAAKNGEKVFFLLDEIFKGTNSKDRHEGAKVLINQLVNNKAMGLVSTHDLELCDLELTRPWLKNYNFQEHYENNNIKFDYKLREGRSETQNAVHLMKLAGIDFES
ncbi:MAG: DNA mismatch repair protein MutS [Clostridium sp.]|uniref:MutS-related protein n=1 Tax=Clostridium sp. TaxID=1506 RepID=UPI00290BBDED|nr:DNA mismatch repair protein MutS [Clostridium sp.]MDU5109006.1 DNA mismatch repair protein MutS [Clostridium sp.]